MSLKLNHAVVSQRIIAFAREGRLIQGGWHGSNDGRETACLLGAMHCDVMKPSDCNGKFMPMWLANLTPTLFDGIPEANVESIGIRYGKLVNDWHVLTDTQWEAINTRFLIRCIDEALDAAKPVNIGKSYWADVEKAANMVTKALQIGNKEELSAARSAASAAESAAWSAASAAESAAWSAASAAESAAWSAAWSAARSAAESAESAAWSAARSAAESAARSAASAAESAAWSAAWSAARSAARSAKYLSLFNFVLDQIELEINTCKGSSTTSTK